MGVADQIRAQMQSATRESKHPVDEKRRKLRDAADQILSTLVKSAICADPEDSSWELAEKQLALLCKKLALVTKGLEESYAVDQREAEAIVEAKRLGAIAKSVKVTTWHGKRIPAE